MSEERRWKIFGRDGKASHYGLHMAVIGFPSADCHYPNIRAYRSIVVKWSEIFPKYGFLLKGRSLCVCARRRDTFFNFLKFVLNHIIYRQIWMETMRVTVSWQSQRRTTFLQDWLVYGGLVAIADDASQEDLLRLQSLDLKNLRETESQYE